MYDFHHGFLCRYVKLRSNAMLFAVLQSTEPFLNSYFEFAPHLPSYLQQHVLSYSHTI